MKQLIFVGLCFFAVQAAHALESYDDTIDIPITICENTDDTDSYQYDLRLKGNGALGFISGFDKTHRRWCGFDRDIKVVGQYAIQANGTYIVTLSTLAPPVREEDKSQFAHCDAWTYQFIWEGSSARGEINFENNEKFAVSFVAGACSASSLEGKI